MSFPKMLAEALFGEKGPDPVIPPSEIEEVDYHRMLQYVRDISSKIDARRFSRYDDFVNRLLQLALTAKNVRIREATTVYLAHLLKKSVAAYNSSQDMLELTRLEAIARKELAPAEYESFIQFLDVSLNRVKFTVQIQDSVQTPQTERLLQTYYPEKKVAADEPKPE